MPVEREDATEAARIEEKTARAELLATHGVAAALFIAFMLGHIYIGTIGMEGAFEAMGEGTVDVNWAREHHSIWLARELEREDKPTRVVPAE